MIAFLWWTSAAMWLVSLAGIGSKMPDDATEQDKWRRFLLSLFATVFPLALALTRRYLVD